MQSLTPVPVRLAAQQVLTHCEKANQMHGQPSLGCTVFGAAVLLSCSASAVQQAVLLSCQRSTTVVQPAPTASSHFCLQVHKLMAINLADVHRRCFVLATYAG
jgi:hypothetical protein